VVREPENERGPDETAGGFVEHRPRPERYGLPRVRPGEAPALILEGVPHSARVLDVGCGSGEIGVLLREIKQCSVVGVEPQPERVAAARQRGLEVHEGVLDERRADELGASFDAVLLVDVLEHLADPAALLERVSRVLAPDAALHLSVPNVAHWTVRANLLRGRFRYAEKGLMDATHLRWFTRETLRELLARTGYQPVAECASAGGWLPAYRHLPWRVLPSGMRRRTVRCLSQFWPTLFGAQFVVRAVRLRGEP